MSTRTGDMPFFPLVNERLDKKDLYLISKFIEETITRSLGSVFSGGGGLLSQLNYTLAYPGGNSTSGPTVTVTFGAFRAAWSAPLVGEPSVFDGGVMTFDPDRPAQTESSWELQLFRGLGVIFWAKRSASAAVIDNRAYWQGRVKYAAVQTQLSEWVDIRVALGSDDPQDPLEGWVPIAYIQSSGWTGYTPTIKPVYFPDSKMFNNGAGPGTKNWWSVYDPDIAGGGSPGAAIGDQLRWIFNVLSRINDSGWVFEADGRVNYGDNEGVLGWQDAPVQGLTQISTELADHEGRLAAIEGASGVSLLALVLEFTWNSGTHDYDEVTIYTNGYFTSSHITVQRGVEGIGYGVQATVSTTGTAAYTIYSVSGAALGKPGLLGDPEHLEDLVAVVRYGAGALPGTSVMFDIYDRSGQTNNRLLLSVFGGKTP